MLVALGLAVLLSAASFWARVDVRATASLRLEIHRDQEASTNMRWDASTRVRMK
jgi:hypothetical protein